MLIDLTFLRSFTGGQSDKMTKYIRMFLTGAPQNISQMELHTLSKDWAGVHHAAHSLKPQLGYFGAKDSEALLKQIEMFASQQIELDKLPAMIETFKKQFEVISTELEQELKSLS
jgi:HPt (histidine-containing phosphotransfer) domain-containing protein